MHSVLYALSCKHSNPTQPSKKTTSPAPSNFNPNIRNLFTGNHRVTYVYDSADNSEGDLWWLFVPLRGEVHCETDLLKLMMRSLTTYGVKGGNLLTQHREWHDERTVKGSGIWFPFRGRAEDAKDPESLSVTAWVAMEKRVALAEGYEGDDESSESESERSEYY